MSYSSIIVQLDIDDLATPRLKFAWELAQRFEAHLIAFAAAEGRIGISSADSTIIAGELVRAQVEEIERRLKELEQEFQQVTEDNPRASWRADIGEPTRLLALYARSADLVVIGSPEDKRDCLRTIDPGSLVLASGRPILMASEKLLPINAKKILVAWKDTREACRAVIDALPFLTGANEVMVVSAKEDSWTFAKESATDVVRFLMRHGVKARSEVLAQGPYDTPGTIIPFAEEIGADLIVAGAYGHSRLREWAFGGMTRALIREGSLHRLLSN